MSLIKDAIKDLNGKEAIHALIKIALLGVGLVAIVAGAMFVYGTYKYDMPTAAMLIWNNVDVQSKDIYYEPKPHDCEFIKAPLGDKDCHFERETTILRSDKGEITSITITWNRVDE